MGLMGESSIHDTSNGFESVFMVDQAGNLFVSFSGTEPGANMQDVVVDTDVGLPQWQAEGDKVAVIEEYLNDNPGVKVNFSGHSLGGVLAEYTTYDTARLIDVGKIPDTNLEDISVQTFNGLGATTGLKKTCK